MAIFKVFKSNIPSVNYFFKKGMQAAFMLGRYETNNPNHIAELEAEVANGHPHIYIDEAETEIDTEALTPMEIIRQQAYEQARADLLASGAMSDKVSISKQGDFKDSITNSVSVAEGAAGSDSGSVANLSAGTVVTGAGIGPSQGAAPTTGPASSMAAAIAALKNK